MCGTRGTSEFGRQSLDLNLNTAKYLDVLLNLIGIVRKTKFRKHSVATRECWGTLMSYKGMSKSGTKIFPNLETCLFSRHLTTTISRFRRMT